jgi:uncharacterized protein YeeX (DUF496 family)
LQTLNSNCTTHHSDPKRHLYRNSANEEIPEKIEAIESSNEKRVSDYGLINKEIKEEINGGSDDDVRE